MKSFVNYPVFNIFFGVLFCVVSINAESPAFITKCQNPMRDCLKESLQASLLGFIGGVPELGIEKLDPFAVESLNLTLPGGLVINLKDSLAKGLRTCVVDKARMIKNIMEIQVHCSLSVKGKYSSTGRLVMFPIDGEGNSTIKCKNIKLSAFIQFESKMIESQKFLEIKKIKASHQFDGRVSYHMTNLIKGNPQMSKMVSEFMNKNWKLVADEFGKPIVDFGMAAIVRNVKQLLKMVPLRDIASLPVDL